MKVEGSRWCFLATLAIVAAGAAVAASPALPGEELFRDGPPRALAIALKPDALAVLREKPRTFVSATITEAGTEYPDVAIHLKGSAGSFRPVDDKPALTLDFSHYKTGQKFHGLRRIHLNNSVEDASYLSEQLGSEIFRLAGVPAPRVSHALVTLNGRQLGLYVLIEGFTEDFLACHFKEVSGDLYEPEKGQDIDGSLTRNSVHAPRRGQSEIKSLAEAARDPDLRRRWERLSMALDTDEFVRFMALEVMLSHRDGYCVARNNFRVYEEADGRKIAFFPHGMDQLFGVEDLPWKPGMSGLVAASLVATPEGASRYKTCLSAAVTNWFNIAALSNRAEAVALTLVPSLTAGEARSLRKAAAELQRKMALRCESLRRQLARPELEPLRFTNSLAPLLGWEKGARAEPGEMLRTQFADGTSALKIEAKGPTSADWRTKALLSPGHYWFEGRVRVAGVKPLPAGRHQGARLRARVGKQSADLSGDSGWQELKAEFVVERPDTEVEFVCELRAAGGAAWFDVSSLRVRALSQNNQ